MLTFVMAILGAAPIDSPLPATPSAPDTAIHSADATARQEAAVYLAGAHDAHSIGLLWLLSFDPEADVRQAALDSTVLRCEHETPGVCVGMLTFFADDPITEIGWSARDHLLRLNVEDALRGASVAYKLDVLSGLGSDTDMPPQVAAQVLRLLADDNDVGVQENATWLLDRTP